MIIYLFLHKFGIILCRSAYNVSIFWHDENKIWFYMRINTLQCVIAHAVKHKSHHALHISINNIHQHLLLYRTISIALTNLSKKLQNAAINQAVAGILYLWSFMATFLKMVTRQTAYINNFN